MEIKKIKNESTKLPNEITINKLSGGLYELIGNQNITEKQRIIDDVETTIYETDMAHITAYISSKVEMIVALVRLRYSQDDEFAIINKGIANNQDLEYVNYRGYVLRCKEIAIEY